MEEEAILILLVAADAIFSSDSSSKDNDDLDSNKPLRVLAAPTDGAERVPDGPEGWLLIGCTGLTSEELTSDPDLALSELHTML